MSRRYNQQEILIFPYLVIFTCLIAVNHLQSTSADILNEDSGGSVELNTTSIHEIQARLINYDEKHNRGCGELPVDFKIVGGRRSYQWPWMAALRAYKKNKKGVRQQAFKCGGVLLTDQHVLTAAHCVADASDVEVQLGHYFYFSLIKENIEEPLVFLSERVFVHEGYRPITLHNDIAVIKLKTRVTLNDQIWPICLPPGDPVLDGKTLHVAGWGKKRDRDIHSSDELLEVEVPVWSNDVCRKMEEPHPFNGERQICAGPREGGKGFCQGDSGGPLMHQPAPGIWTVVGIVSSAYGCGAVNRPGIYTRVSSYTEWIVAKLFL